MALKVINKINGKLKFPRSLRIFCNVLIHPHFDHTCPAWYPNLTKKAKKKIQITQIKCIRFCLRMNKMHHISGKNFRSTNWLPTSKRVNRCISTITTKFINNICPYYLNEIFEFAPHCRTETRNKFAKLKIPFLQDKYGPESYFIRWSFFMEQFT